MREVRVHPDSGDKEAFVTSNWAGEDSDGLREVSEAGYRAWLSKALLQPGSSKSIVSSLKPSHD